MAGSPGMSRSRSARTLDGIGHREPKDWSYESMRQMQDAENTIRIGNTDRLHSHNTIHFGSKVDHTNDTRVERALKSKLSQTTKLRGLLEETLAKTNVEISKMEAIRKYLAEERQKFEVRYARNQVCQFRNRWYQTVPGVYDDQRMCLMADKYLTIFLMFVLSVARCTCSQRFSHRLHL